jgi:hypothetical protein
MYCSKRRLGYYMHALFCATVYYDCSGTSALTSSRPGLFLYEMSLSCKEEEVFLVYLVCV